MFESLTKKAKALFKRLPWLRPPRNIGGLSLTGFTLVEIVVSLSILATVVAGVMASFVASQRFISRSNRRLQAANVSRQAFSQLRAGVDAGYWANPGNDMLDIKDWTPCNDLGINPPLEIDLSALATFNPRCNYRVEPVAGQAFRQVTLNISWDEP